MLILNIISFILISITILLIIMLEVDYGDTTDKTFTTLCIFATLIFSILLYVLNMYHS